MKDKVSAYFLSILFFISLGLGRINMSSGYAIKPYMIVTALILIYNIYSRRTSIKPIALYEYLYCLFLFIVALSVTTSFYPRQTLRFSIASILLIIMYFTLRLFFTNFISIQKIKRSIARAGLIVGIANLAYYILGILGSNFNFHGNAIIRYGLLLDRNFPRLVGTASNDPNFTAIYLSFFFLFFLLQKRYYLEKLLFLILIMLTFSRGAYFSIIVALAIYYVLTIKRSSISKLIRNIIGSVIILFFAIYTINIAFKINVISTITDRVQTISSDEGSGRTALWANAIDTYKQRPVYGIGANSSLEYNIDHYNSNHYSHNTYLEALSELGVIGFFVFISFILLALRAAYVSCRYNQNYSLLLFLAILMQINFLSTMTSEILLIAVLMIVVYGQEAKRISIIQNKIKSKNIKKITESKFGYLA